MQDFKHMEKVPIKKLEPRAAAKLFRQNAGNNLEHKYLKYPTLLEKHPLLKFLDYNPAAIIQMAPLIR